MENHHFLMGKSTISRAIFNRYVCLPEGNQWIDKYLAFRQSLEILRFEKNDHVIIQQNGGFTKNDRSLFSRSLESWFMLGKSSPFMAQEFR